MLRCGALSQLAGTPSSYTDVPRAPGHLGAGVWAWAGNAAATYRDVGYAVVPGVLDAGAVAGAAAYLDTLAARLGLAPALTVWVALSDADEANGCLRVVPGSQVLPPQPLYPDRPDRSDRPDRPGYLVPSFPGRGRSLFGVGMDEALVDGVHAVSVCVRAGDAAVHHPNLVHCSLPNRSERRRLALAVRYRAER